MPMPAILICQLPALHNTLFKNKSLNEIIDICIFNNENDCKLNLEKYFQKYSTFEYGDCLLFNSDNKSSLLVGDTDHGLKVQFRNYSIMIYINDATTSKIPIINGYIYKVPDYTIQNMHFNFKLSKSEQIKLGPPYNECYNRRNENKSILFNKTLIDFIQSFNISYKQTYCLQLCSELEFIETNPCNCTHTSLGYVKQDCRDNTSNKMTQNCTSHYFKDFMKQSIKKCEQKYCPKECDSIKYSFEAIPFKNPTDSTSFNIYFDELKYELHQEIPKTELFDLISNIGGILGLFIGCSFVTFFELCELILEIIFFSFNTCNFL